MVGRKLPDDLRELLAAPESTSEDTLQDIAQKWRILFVDNPEAALQCAEVGLELADRFGSRLRSQFTALVGSSLRGLSRYDEAETRLQEALDLLGNDLPTQKADIYLKKAYLELHRLEYGLALEYTDMALELLKDREAPEDVGRILVCRGNILGTMGDYEGSLKHFLRSLARLDPQSNPTTYYSAILGISKVLVELEDYDVLPSFVRELRAAKNALPRSLNKYRIALRWTEGLFLAKQGRYRRADNVLAGVDEKLTRIGSAQEVAILSIDIAQVKLHLGNNSRARAHLERAVRIMRKFNLNPKAIEAVERVRDQIGKGAVRAWAARAAVSEAFQKS